MFLRSFRFVLESHFVQYRNSFAAILKVVVISRIDGK